jgi:molybdenum cofactor cytidylyltransferase
MPPDSSAKLSLAVVILGAGASARMGRPKLLLPWGKTSILGHLVTEWEHMGANQIAIVCAEANQPLDAELDGVGFPARNRIVNSHPERGMFSSVRCAAQWPGWNRALTHWVIVLGDQPHLRRSTLAGLSQFAAAHPEKICQPSRHGRPRHPVILPRNIFEQLAQATEADLKQFLRNRSQETALQEMDDPGLDFDIDEPADYEKAVRTFLTDSD